MIGTFARHQECGGSTVGKLRGVPCRDRTLTAVGIEVGLEREQAFERGVRAIAFVAVAADFFGTDFFAGLFIEHGFDDFHGSNFISKKTFLLGAGGALLTDQGVLVLSPPGDLVTLSDHLCGLSHDHVDTGIFLLEPGTGIVVANDEADGFHAAADGSVGALCDDLVRSHRNGLQSGRAETVHSDGGRRYRKPCEQRGDARNVMTLNAVRLSASENHVFNFAGIELRSFAQDILDAMRSHFFGTRHVERAAKRFGEAGARTGYYYGFFHFGRENS